MTVAFTPGSYLTARRVAAGLSIEDVAARLATDPHVPEIDRIAWVTLIEADQAPISVATMVSLRAVFRFDTEVLERLIDLTDCNATLPAPRLCRICACSDRDACVGPGASCAWAGDDLCTACVPSLPCRAAGGAAVPVASASLPSPKGAEA